MIGERLAEIRKDHGDTQAALAKQLEVSLSTIRSWEQEKSSPSHELLIAICKLYQVSADYLLGLSGTDVPHASQKNSPMLTPEDIRALHDYEKYLVWKHKHC